MNTEEHTNETREIVEETKKRSAYNLGDTLRKYKNAQVVKDVLAYAESNKDDVFCLWLKKGFEGAHYKEADHKIYRFNELGAIFKEKSEKQQENDLER